MATTYPEPLKTWNQFVSDTVRTLRTVVQPVNSTQLVNRVERGVEYHLSLAVKVVGKCELAYTDIEIRLVGQADQVQFLDPPGAIDSAGKPRIHLHTGHLYVAESKDWLIRFRARKTISTKSLKFNTGIYGIIEPQGHFWTVLNPV